MNKTLKHFLIVLTTVFIAQSCKKDDTVQIKATSKLIQGTIAGVNGPTIGSVNQELTFSLIWQNANPSIKFSYVKDSISHNVNVVKLYALTNADTTVTTPKAINPIPYKFKAATAGTYYLKFYQADNSDKTAIIDTLVIK